jgi:hypothetical protein
MFDVIDIPFGSRYFGYWGKGYGDQIKVSTFDEIKALIDEHLGLDNIGISISTYKDGVPFLLYLPFDFDSGDLRESWEDAKKLYNFMVDNNYKTYLIFSGRKGFHVLVSTKPKMYTKKQLRMTQRMFKDIFSLKTLDEAIFGDIRRIMRIPETFNINGSLCKILAFNDGELLDLDSIYKDEYIPSNGNGNSNGKLANYHDYPCIDKLIIDRDYWVKNHSRHRFEPAEAIRLTWAAVKLNSHSIDEVLDEAKSYGWDDWDYDKTRKKLEYLCDRDWHPHSCQTLKGLGYCIIKNCCHKDINEDLKSLGII